MNIDDVEEFLFHADAISEFNVQTYSDIFTKNNIITKKKALIIGNEKFYGYFLEKGLEIYFVLDAHMEHLPFRVSKYKELDYKTDVYKLVTSVEPITIKPQKVYNIREMVHLMSRFSHTNRLHQLLFNIAMFTAWVDRVNFRASTESSFGKDSAVNIISHMVNDTSNIYGATFAKLEYVLKNNLIILNELGNLNKEEKTNMQEFLLHAGAMFNKYTKRTRKSGGTLEEYDISKLSLVIFYNLPEYYSNKNQEYFDQMFQKAVLDRFIPFVFKGRLCSKFENVIDPKQIVEDNKEIYKGFIASLIYYKENPLTEIKYEMPHEIYFSKERISRYGKSFNIISKYISEYCETQEEFTEMVLELYNSYLAYNELIDNGDIKTERKETKQKIVKKNNLF